jgi:hypothetical protein
LKQLADGAPAAVETQEAVRALLRIGQ